MSVARWFGLFGICILGVPAQAQQAQWTPFSEEDGYTLMTGVPAVKDGITEIDLLFVYEQPRPHLDHWFYNSVRQTFQYDCAQKAYRVTRLEMFEDKVGGGKAIARRTFNDPLQEFRPDTRAGLLAKVACAK